MTHSSWRWDWLLPQEATSTQREHFTVLLEHCCLIRGHLPASTLTDEGAKDNAKHRKTGRWNPPQFATLMCRSFHTGNKSGSNTKDSVSYLFGWSKAIQIASSVTSSSLHRQNVNHQRAFFDFFLLFFVLDLGASEVALSGNFPGNRSSSRQTLLLKGTVHMQKSLPSQTSPWQECKTTACLLLPPPGRFCDSRWLSLFAKELEKLWTEFSCQEIFRKGWSWDREQTNAGWWCSRLPSEYRNMDWEDSIEPFPAHDQSSKAEGLWSFNHLLRYRTLCNYGLDLRYSLTCSYFKLNLQKHRNCPSAEIVCRDQSL